ncbi:hypothetical protein KbCgl_10090 [Corynebacterium glutamicum]|nr:hypothetical protein KbCgl_10090 [Corynebacterium glutamicum]
MEALRNVGLAIGCRLSTHMSYAQEWARSWVNSSFKLETPCRNSDNESLIGKSRAQCDQYNRNQPEVQAG